MADRQQPKTLGQLLAGIPRGAIDLIAGVGDVIGKAGPVPAALQTLGALLEVRPSEFFTDRGLTELQNLITTQETLQQKRAATVRRQPGGFARDRGTQVGMPSAQAAQPDVQVSASAADRGQQVRRDQLQKEKEKTARTQVTNLVGTQGIQRTEEQLNQADQAIDRQARDQVLQARQLRNLALTGQEQPGVGRRFLAGLSRGLRGETAESVLSNLIKAQQVAGEVPLQIGEREKAGITLLGQTLPTRIKEAKALEAQQKLADKFVSDLSQFTDAFDRAATGPVGSRFSRLLPGGREKLSELSTLSQNLVFSVGSFLLGQTGRGFSQEEQETVRENMVAKDTDTMSTFFGKMQGLLNLANQKLADADSPTRLPPIRELIRRIRSERQFRQGSGVGVATDQDLLDAIAEAERRGI